MALPLYGSLKELVGVQFRKDSQLITLRPNQAVTYSAARDVQFPPQDAASVLVSETATQTLTNKTLDNTNTVTLKDNKFTLQDDGDVTKQTVFQLSGITTGNTRTLTVPDASTTLVGTDATQTLTNKTINGASNTLTVRAASDITGQLPIGNGGTGQATKAAAFDALSPTTTKGDLIAYSTTNARLPVGSNGQVLTADSTQTLGVKWAAAGSGSVASADGTTTGTVTTYAPVIKSAIKQVTGANYTILDNDGYNTVYVDCSGADRTVTLPATATNVGRRIRIIKTDTNQTFVVNINRAGSDVIYCGGDNAATTVPLQKFNECRELECMASGTWVQVEAASTTITLVSLNGGFTGGNVDLVRVGNIVHVQVQSPTWNSGQFTYTSTLTVDGKYRPAADVVFCGAPSNGSHNYHMTWLMLSTGAVRVEVSSNVTTGPDNYPMFSGSYIIR